VEHSRPVSINEVAISNIAAKLQFEGRVHDSAPWNHIPFFGNYLDSDRAASSTTYTKASLGSLDLIGKKFGQP